MSILRSRVPPPRCLARPGKSSSGRRGPPTGFREGPDRSDTSAGRTSLEGTVMQINALILDAKDPERLAAFWSELLGRPIVGRTGPYVWLRRENGLGMGIQRND